MLFYLKQRLCEMSCFKRKTKPKDSKNYSFLVFVYICIAIFVFSLFLSMLFSIDFNNAKTISVVFIIIGLMCLPVGAVFLGYLFWVIINSVYGKGVADLVSITLTSLYIFISLLLGILITKFSIGESTFDKLNSIMQITWAVFGISITIYTVMVGFLSSLDKEKRRTVFEDYLMSLYPVMISSVSIMISSIILYCFFDNCLQFANTMVNVSFISSVISVPYYLMSCLHLYRKISTMQQEDKKTK